jgi:hypothetical protein
LAVLVTVSMLGAGGYCAPAQAAQAAKSGIPTAEELSLQARLENDLDLFGAKELPQAEALGCDGVSAAYDSALKLDGLVNGQLDVIHTEEAALPRQGLVDAGLVALRLTQLGTDLAAIVVTLPEAQAELVALSAASKGSAIVKAVTEAMSAVVSTGAAFIASAKNDDLLRLNPNVGSFQIILNEAAGLYSGITPILKSIPEFSSQTSKLGLSVGGVLSAIDALVHAYQAIQDFRTAWRDADAHVRALLDAYGLYGDLLDRLEAAMGALQAQMDSCTGTGASGIWKETYYCKHGWCAGQVFYDTYKLVQAHGSSVVTGESTASGATLTGRFSGNTLKLDGTQPGYSWSMVVTVSGNSFSGTLTDSNGTSGTTTGARVRGPTTTSTTQEGVRG